MTIKTDINIAKTLDFTWTGLDFYLKSSSEVVFKKNNRDNQEINLKDWSFIKRKEEKSNYPGIKGEKIVKDYFVQEDLVLIREISFSLVDASFLYIRLILKNQGKEDVNVEKLLPLSISGRENLKIGKEKFENWRFFSQGRYKNDLPSVSSMGKFDLSYKDALRKKEQNSIVNKDEKSNPLGLISDELCVIKSGKNINKKGLLLAFLKCKDQLVRMELEGDDQRKNFKSLKAICFADNYLLQGGSEIKGEWLKLDISKDIFQSINNYTEEKKKITGFTVTPNPPSVYCTWYYYGDSVKEIDVKTNLKYLAQLNLPVDVFQIDEGWERRWGDWQENHHFPSGMKQIAEQIRKKGFRPGIWTCPFLVEPRSKLIYDRSDWLLKDREGIPIRFAMNNMNNFVLDVTHPEVLKWLEDLYAHLTKDCGYTYHKLDFTRAVILDSNIEYYNKSVTRAQAYRKGLEAIRKGTGSKAYILMCGGLYSAAAGLVDAQRTGSDVLSIWPESNNDEIIAPFTIKQNVLRYWMNDLWHNDPDALMVRRKINRFRNLDLSLGLLNDDEVKIMALNQYFGGGIICFTEDLENIEKDRLGVLRHIIPSIGKAAVPRDLFQEKRYPAVYDTKIKSTILAHPDWHTITLINWSNHQQTFDFFLEENFVGDFAKKNTDYIISEFWSTKIWNSIKYGDKIELEIKPHSAILLRVAEEIKDEPQLIYTNGHFSMGKTEINKWIYNNNKLELGINWPWDYPLELIIRMTGELVKTPVLNDKRIKLDIVGTKDLKVQIKGPFQKTISLIF